MTTTVTLANSVTLGQPSVDDAGVTWWHRGVTGWRDGVPMKANWTDRPAGPGVYDTPVFPGARVVVLTGTAMCPDHQTRLQAMRRLQAVGATGSLLSLRIADELGELEAMARRTDKPTITMAGAASFDYTMQFTAPSPRLLDATTRMVSTQMAQSGAGGVQWNGPAGATGTQWNGPSPGSTGLQWGQPTANGIVTLDNTEGTDEADVILTITGPAQTPAVAAGGGWIVYNGALSASDVLVINTGSGSVLLNGVNRRPLLTRADWFTIPPGGTLDVRFVCDVQNSTASMTASWRVSYL